MSRNAATSIFISSKGFEDIPALPFPEPLDFATSQIHRDSELWERIDRRIQESLPGAMIEDMRRFADRSLWKMFTQKRELMDRSKHANTQLLFHGTSQPKNITGTGFGENGNGFDPRLAGNGAYGKGAYFAQYAWYPVTLINRTEKNVDGTITLFVAEVILGEPKDFGNETNNKLTRPPPKDDKIPNVLYDSVSGTETSIAVKRGRPCEWGRQHVVYDSHMAYPHIVFKLRLAQPDSLALLPPLAEHSSGLNCDGGGNAIYLDRHKVMCPGSGVLVSFHLRRGRDSKDNLNQIEFSFISQPLPVDGKVVEHQTKFNDDGGGNACYLDRHTLMAPDGHALKGFHMERVKDDVAGWQYRFVYWSQELNELKLGSVEKLTTPLNDDGKGNVVFLDRHAFYSEWHSPRVLKGFHVSRSGTPDKIQIEYWVQHLL